MTTTHVPPVSNLSTKHHQRIKSRSSNPVSPKTADAGLGRQLLGQLRLRLGFLLARIDAERLCFYSHASVLLHVLLYVLGFGVSSHASSHALLGLTPFWSCQAFYRRALCSLLLAYGLPAATALLALKRKAELDPDIQKAPHLLGQLLLADANLLYFALSLWLVFSDSFDLLFYTLAIYSFYHVSNHLRDSLTSNNRLVKSLILPTLALQPNMLLMCAHVEILALPVMFVRWIFLGCTSAFSLMFYFQFLRFQFVSSERTRLAFKEVDRVIKRALVAPVVPKHVLPYYERVARIVAKMAPEFKPHK